MKSLDLLLWLTLGPLVVAAVVLVGGFVAELVNLGERGDVPRSRGRWHPRTEAEADTAPLADAPETEAAIAHMWAQWERIKGRS